MTDIVKKSSETNLKNTTNKKRWSRNCPDCNRVVEYSSSQNLWRAKQYNHPCKSCAHSGNRSHRKGKPCANLETLKRVNTGNTYNLGRVWSNARRKSHSTALINFHKTERGQECIRKRTESIRKMRMLMGNDGKYRPNYNKLACQFFDYLNSEMGWNGVHALNGGEFYISEYGYWVDYYESSKNMVIEWDERTHHFKNKERVKKDIVREENIKALLKCKFIRIPDKSNFSYAKSIVLNNC